MGVVSVLVDAVSFLVDAAPFLVDIVSFLVDAGFVLLDVVPFLVDAVPSIILTLFLPWRGKTNHLLHAQALVLALADVVPFWYMSPSFRRCCLLLVGVASFA